MKYSAKVPEELKGLFEQVEGRIAQFFNQTNFKPNEGKIEISGERYILLRASSLSIDFFNSIVAMYQDTEKESAINIARQLLFDVAHATGKEDAQHIINKLKLISPVEKLAAGPIHFAYTGWAFVDILPESKPTADDNFFLIYDHPFSFESDSWIHAGKKSDQPVCIMNAGYSSGWCEVSFGISLVATEILCKAKGDPCCRFVMAPPNKIDAHVKRYIQTLQPQIKKNLSYEIPAFFQLKSTQDELKRINRALTASEEKFYSISNSAHDAIVLTNHDNQIIFWNSAATKIFGYLESEVIGKNIFEKIIPWMLQSKYEDKLKIGSTQEIESSTKDGKTIFVELSVSQTKILDQQHTILIFRDISGRKVAEKNIYYQATHDMLTQLLNRHSFINQAENTIALCNRNHKKAALFFIDIDHFKKINDQFGHAIGDNLLQTISQRITNCIRKSDIVGRLGGDEFAILSYNIESIDHAEKLAQKLIIELKKPYQFENISFSSTVSIGIALFPDHANNLHEWIKRSDTAMYKIKSTTRNGYITWS